ncbi:Sas10 C-terminal domain-containing protein [Pseudomassariella vexata]|uniref:Sas10 C-terminal domain-domain-containing protein n=1 Tax=Pseudomassariella vexata TaxID=1141098 RepID=A0A1Y2EDQ7_9PEZI|nr:Sas10 C-terminal domain-containing protein [Pseudomassariella vexata]ORY69690.1 Sas10 C-terminal domain-domain-containing protein [Pseudomassariella vexata]
MGKKRKASAKPTQPSGPRDYDPKEARLGPVNTFEDLGDSEEEYWKNQDEILFDDAPKSKKQKRLEEEEEFLEDSDVDVLDYNQDSSEDEDEDEDVKAVATKFKKGAKAQDDESGSERGNEDDEDPRWWGASRKEYYNADQIETEGDALEEEREALRLQKKKLSKLREEDFIFNEDEWMAPEDEKKDGNAVVTEVLKDAEIPEDMSPEERLRLLQARYPELEYLAEELLQLQPLLVTLQKDAEGQTSKSLATIKYRILGCYVATLALYFATLTSPARDADGSALALDPAELRDHEVMGTLLECREAWKRVKDLKASKTVEATASLLSPPEEDAMSVDEDLEVSLKRPKKTDKKKKSKRVERPAVDIEDSLADLSALMTTAKKSEKKAKAKTTSDELSDFGDEEALDSKAAAEKAARKKSLRFYTSQIVQKANRRAGAGRDAGGDVDIPYRERLRDRQARLNREAVKRGQSAKGVELGGDSDDEDQRTSHVVREDEDEYYDMVAHKTAAKKEGKAARAAALAAASASDRVVETEEIGEDGKRKITYAIEKNKGLAPKRKKDNNPRVKKRKKYADKQKKLKSMKAVYKGGEGKGGYGGELTGIKSGLIKSRKL